jgi:hypothetical protein
MNPQKLHALGWAQYRNRQHAQAAISVGEALRKVPGEPLFLYHAAIIAYTLGNKEKAREYAQLSAAALTSPASKARGAGLSISENPRG